MRGLQRCCVCRDLCDFACNVKSAQGGGIGRTKGSVAMLPERADLVHSLLSELATILDFIRAATENTA
jgi:hypothetical protein